MIELRAYKAQDGVELAANLHAISADEVANAGFTPADIPGYLDREAERGHATSGFINDVLAFVGCSTPQPDGTRNTTFFLASGLSDVRVCFTMRAWRKAELAIFPGVKGVVNSFSRHPMRDRYFTLGGLKKVSDNGVNAIFTT